MARIEGKQVDEVQEQADPLFGDGPKAVVHKGRRFEKLSFFDVSDRRFGGSVTAAKTAARQTLGGFLEGGQPGSNALLVRVKSRQGKTIGWGAYTAKVGRDASSGMFSGGGLFGGL